MLTTPRLLLRPQEPEDAVIFHRLWEVRDPRVPAHRQLDAHGRPTVDDIAENIRESGASSLLLSVVLRESSELLGYAGLVFRGKGADGEAEIAFELLRSAHGNGYATEAGEAVIAWAKELGHRRLWASVWDWNVASRRVLEKLGFRDSGVQKPATEHGRTILTVLNLMTPTVVGERVTLREYADEDASLVASVVDDPLIPLISTVPAGGDLPRIHAYIERQRGRAVSGTGWQFAILDNASGEAIGQVGLTFREPTLERASVGYWIAPQHRGAGFATAAVQVLVEWAFAHLSVQRLELYVEPWNEGSWRAAESEGFVREGLLRRWERVGAERRDMYMYSRLREGVL